VELIRPDLAGRVPSFGRFLRVAVVSDPGNLRYLAIWQILRKEVVAVSESLMGDSGILNEKLDVTS
jgi:hypothetical protein